jgi:alkylation response protein AidB-like acyl-CoA dehydrogenase
MTREQAREQAAASIDTAAPLRAARQIVPHVGGAADEIERIGKLPPSLVAALHEARLFRLLLPAAVDGEEVEPRSFLEVVEEIAKADGSTAWCLAQTSVCTMFSVLLAADVAQEIFVDRAAVLAMGYGADACAVAVEGGYRVTGKWSFASGGHHATWLASPCIEHEADGTPRLDGYGKPMPRTVLFPASVAPLQPVWNVLGLKGTGSDAYSVSNLFVPTRYSFNPTDLPLAASHRPLYLFPPNSLWGSGFAAIALGIARGVLDALIDLATQKTPRGATRPMANEVAVQSLIARSEAKLQSARMFLFNAIETSWRCALAGEVNLARRIAIRLAASHAIAEAKGVVDGCYDAAGATAVFAAQPFERRFRDIHAVTQHLHGRGSHFELVGQFMLGLAPNTTFL